MTAPEDRPDDPREGVLYEFDVTTFTGKPDGSRIGWWSARGKRGAPTHGVWTACFDEGMWSPQFVTGWRVAALSVAPQPQPAQRQDSATDQLRDLIPIANRHGMCDAADAVQQLIERAQS